MIHGEEKQRPIILTDATTERKRLTWTLKLAIINSLLRANYNDNVDKQSQNTHARCSKPLCQAKVKSSMYILDRYIHTYKLY